MGIRILVLAEAPVTILKFDGTERTVTTELSDPRAVFKEAGIAVGQADRIEEKTSGRGKVLGFKTCRAGYCCARRFAAEVFYK